MQNVMQALYLTRNARGLPASARRYTYGIHAYDFKLKKAAWGFILAVMMVPTQVFAIGYYKFMIQLKLIDTYWPLIIPAIATPVVVFVMYFLLSRYIVEGVSLGSVKG